MKEKNRYFKIGLTAFLIIAAGILFYFFVLRIGEIVGFLKKVLAILTPILIGGVVAYLLNPVVELIGRGVFSFLSLFKLETSKKKKIAKFVGITLSMILFLTMLALLLWGVIPGVYASVIELASNINNYANTLYEIVLGWFEGNEEATEMVTSIFKQASSTFTSWFNVELLGSLTKFMTKITSGLMGVLKSVIYVFLGLCVAVYILKDKHKLIGQFKKIIYARMKNEKANVLLAIGRQVDGIFGGFISGKIIDSVIIGVLCYIGTCILKMPYKELISIVIGVTNIIPMFGPWIGAIPCTLLILVVDPQKALIFAIFILVLQQFDGNIIGPNILGDTTGLSPFWVVVAITLGGGLFNVAGMILGVPVMSVIYFLVKTIVEYKLKQHEMPLPSLSYVRVKRIDAETKKAEFIGSEMSKVERRRKGIDKKEVSEEIEIAAKLAKERNAEKEKRKRTKNEEPDKKADQ